MCGICGIATTHGAADVESLRAMSDLLVHRGPDSAGEHVDGGVALAARRLSIIDLEHGDQPIANEDGSCVVVQNGEIYNYPELRRELERAGHVLRTHCDTEALVHLYEEHGVGFAERLRGMFAVAIWDARAPPAGARARPLRDQAALLPARRRRAALRVGAAGASARRDRPRRARGVPRLQLDPGPVLDLPRRPQAAGGARPRLGGRRGHARALRAARPGDGGRAARRRRGRAHRGAARSVARLGASASPLGRARRRPPLGRRRLGGARRARGAGDAGGGAHLHDRLCGAQLRRARRRAARGRAIRDGAPRAARAAGAGAAAAGARRGVRRALRRLVGAADLSRLPARGRAREGRALGRGRRRALRRLLHVLGRPLRRPPGAARAPRPSAGRGAARIHPQGEPRLQGKAVRPRRAPAAARAASRLEGDLLGRGASRAHRPPRRVRPGRSPTHAVRRDDRERRSSRDCRTSTSASTSSTTCS